MDHGNMGSSAPSSAAAPRPDASNAADVTFATHMIPHHHQAISMASMAESKASTPEVKALATRISRAQEPEITTMSGWLKAWGAPVPEAGGTHHGGTGDHAPGMMTEQEMAQLTAATGKDFDKMFLEMMIKHHDGAVEMAKTEQQQGTDPAVKQLAGQIATSQTAEITEMRGLLAKL